MIELRNLNKEYGQHTALYNLSLTIGDGRIYGLLGPNGAGKSTTMNIMAGCLAATNGEVIINGRNITTEPMSAKRLIGYLPETPPLYTDMTPCEYLRFVATAKGVAKNDIAVMVSDVMERTGTSDVQNRLIRSLSKGYRQRIGIAQALLGEPEYIILDEPTVGLDPGQIIGIRELIRGLGEKHTVILSSHILSEVAEICDEIIVIADGKLIASDTPENLISDAKRDNTVTVTFKTDDPTDAVTALNGIDGVISVSEPEISDGTARFSVNTGENDLREQVFYTAVELKIPIIEMSLYRPTLEQVFIELTTPDGTDGQAPYVMPDETETDWEEDEQ